MNEALDTTRNMMRGIDYTGSDRIVAHSATRPNASAIAMIYRPIVCHPFRFIAGEARIEPCVRSDLADVRRIAQRQALAR
jgi:hypothetical protein